MSSFDIVSQLNMQEVDNAVNNTVKEIRSRYDFKGTNASVELDRKNKTITIVAPDKMKSTAIRDMLIRNFIKRSEDPKAMVFGKNEATSGGQVRQKVDLQEGIEREIAAKIVKEIKSMKLKVQPAIQEEHIRVSGKKIDDLQEVINYLKQKNWGLPLQYINFR